MLDASRPVRHKKREVVEALPREYYLARSRMERFDVMEELRQMHSAEARRHNDSLTIPPLGLVERKCPYGAPLPVKKSRPKKANLQLQTALQASHSQPVLPSTENPQNAKKKYPGLILLEIPYDPTTFPNEHDERIRAIDGQIADKELSLERSDSEGALRMRQSFSAKAPEFHFDHLPDGTISESTSQAGDGRGTAVREVFPEYSLNTRCPDQFFPRSHEIMTDIGCGKD